MIFWECGLWLTEAFHRGMCKGVEWDGGEGPILQVLNASRRPPGRVTYMSALCWQDDQLPLQLVPMRSPVSPFSGPFCIPTKTPQGFQDRCFIFSSSSVTTVAAQQTPTHMNTPLLPRPKGHKGKNNLDHRHFKTFRKQPWATLSPHTVRPGSGAVVVHRHISINKVK